MKDKENAITRPLRTTRAKPPSATSQPAPDAKPAGTTRATAPTVATRAKSVAPPSSSRLDLAAQGKRKREALGEVARPAANVTKGVHKDAPGASTDLKGKAKAKETFDGVVVKKPPSTIKASTSTSKQSLKPPFRR